MSSKMSCPFCHQPIADAERHMDVHAEAQELFLFVLDSAYHLDPTPLGWRCPLCPFSGLPFSLYSHILTHYLFHPSTVGDVSLCSSDEEESRLEPTSSKRKSTCETPEASSNIGFTPSSSIPRKRPRTNLHSAAGATDPNTLRTPAARSADSGIETPPASAAANHKRQKGDGNPPPASVSVRTALTLDMKKQFSYVRTFLNDNKGACLLHGILSRSQAFPHTSLAGCDLAHRIGDSEYSTFRSDFRSSNNASRCWSCGSPKIEGIHHKGGWNGPPSACKDDDLQDWVVGLAFYTWKFVPLREMVFYLLGIPRDAFGSGSEGAKRFACWLGLKNGRDMSTCASNLLDFLTVFSLNAESLFGKFETLQDD